MCDKSIKTEIYSLFDEGLTTNEVIEKLGLYEYKSVVNGCHTYYNRIKDNRNKNELELEKDKLDLDYEKLKIAIKNFAESGRELMSVLQSLNGIDFIKKADTYTFLRQIVLHEIENEHTDDVKVLKLVSQSRRNYKRIGEAVTRFDKKDRNNLNSLVVLTENLVKLFSVNANDGTEKFINNRINKKDTNVVKMVELIRELI